jgi:uncharacterized membrane protein YhiD involved in acid resistance
MNIAQYLQTVFQFYFTFGEIMENLAMALFCALLIALFYYLSYRGPGLSNTYLTSLVLLPMITAVIIMVIGNNLARAFGLVGAMSIIRFRTAVKNTLDIIFIFFSLAIGMATGVGQHGLALASTLFVGLIATLLTRTQLLNPGKGQFLLQFTTTGEPVNRDDDEVRLALIRKYSRRHRLIDVKTSDSDDSLEMSYFLTLKDPRQGSDLIRELRRIEGVSHINLLYDEDDI